MKGLFERVGGEGGGGEQEKNWLGGGGMGGEGRGGDGINRVLHFSFFISCRSSFFSTTTCTRSRKESVFHSKGNSKQRLIINNN